MSQLSSGTVPHCRLCGSGGLPQILDLGEQPVSNRLRVRKADLEYRHPLRLHYCETCGLVQIVDPVPADKLYVDIDNYNTSYQHHRHVDELINTILATTEARSVVEIASNDGFFLGRLRDAGFTPLVGIEPNRRAAEIARQGGLDVRNEFLNVEICRKLKSEFGTFDLVAARHVVEHLTDLSGFFNCLNMLLSEDGVFLIELPHVEAGYRAGAPSVFWEEHVNYFSEPLIEEMLINNGLEPFEHRYYSYGGGVIAVLARRAARKPNRISWGRVKFDHSYFLDFRLRVEAYRDALANTLRTFKKAGYRVALYGVGHRSCTTLEYAGIQDGIDFAIDDRPDISGRYMAGTNLEVRPLNTVQADMGPLLVLLGVGAEHERKVSAKARAYFSSEPTFISLFYPRDTIASCERALKRLAESQR